MRVLSAILLYSLMLPTLALAQIPGPAMSNPTSTRASNIIGADTSNPIAPQLPAPSVRPGADARGFLMAARQALAGNRTGEAQEALERAETRLLDRSTARNAASRPSDQRMVRQISEALNALASGNIGVSMQLLNSLLGV